ncbi:hypothetical protein ACIHCQ_18395 [Streptomyces sp. NPDC052236]|uniref:hypothetical protein n=1 Tax=Streptomyces sp. NPDC052236 TaxID=3365686 RepID=UPI0037CCD010
MDRVRETYTLGRKEGMAWQRRKIAEATAPAYSAPTEQECAERWDRLGEQAESAGDCGGFIAGLTVLQKFCSA